MLRGFYSPGVWCHKLVKCYIWSVTFYDAQNGKLRKVNQKHFKRSEVWCWRRMDKISWTDRVSNEEVLHRVKEERNILHTVKWKNAKYIGHILRGNYLLKHVTEKKIKGREDEKEAVGSYRMTNETIGYWKLDGTVWKTGFGSRYGHIRQTTWCGHQFVSSPRVRMTNKNAEYQQRAN